MAIAREENCHILLTHYSGKVDRQDGDDILGSTAFLGGVDTLIQMKKRDKRRTFFTIQRYGADVSETVVELTPDGVLEGAGTRQEAELEETIPLIVNACEGAPRTEREIWDEIEKKHDIALKAIRVAVDRGILSRKGGGKKNDPYLYEILSCAPQGVIPTSGRESETNAKPLKVRQEFSPQCFNLDDETSGRESAGWEDLR